MTRTHYLGGMVLAGLTGLLLATTAPAQNDDLQKRINAAIDKGVEYLKKTGSNGVWARGDDPGATILAAWTLLEMGVPPDDPVLTKATTYIRQVLVRENKIYNMSLGIFFLDKLGDPQDIPLLEALGIRLLAGQNRYGGWSYYAPMVENQELNWLKQVVERRQGVPPRKPANPKGEPIQRDVHQLTPEARLLLNALANRPKSQDLNGGDNSNTQFAMIALWVARRYGVPADRALQLTGQRFRSSQNKQGYWGYGFYPPGSIVMGEVVTPAMTCAGLLGLALEHAINLTYSKTPPPPLLVDPAVKAGFKVLGNVFDKGYAEMAPPGASSEGNRLYYFLWSLERMGMVYNVAEINGKNWYLWGVNQLLPAQGADGSWSGAYHLGGCDTCFALLFLHRANVVKDLTKIVTEGKRASPPPIVENNPRDPPKTNVKIDLTPFIIKPDPKSGSTPKLPDPEEKKKKSTRIKDDQGFLTPPPRPYGLTSAPVPQLRWVAPLQPQELRRLM